MKNSTRRVRWDAEAMLARFDDQSARLSPQDAAVFCALATHPGVVRSKKQLVDMIYWDRQEPPKTATRMIALSIMRIRRALPSLKIVTRKKYGFVIDLTGEHAR